MVLFEIWLFDPQWCLVLGNCCCGPATGSITRARVTSTPRGMNPPPCVITVVLSMIFQSFIPNDADDKGHRKYHERRDSLTGLTWVEVQMD